MDFYRRQQHWQKRSPASGLASQKAMSAGAIGRNAAAALGNP
jgi:hypothetical protein